MSYFVSNYYDRISQGDYSNIITWTKVGYNAAITTSEETVWSAGGVYVFPTAAGKWEVVSSDNTQDIGAVIKGDATGDTVEADADGSTTTLEDDSVDFEAATAVAAGDCVILDPHGTTPEWGYVTGVATHTLTVAGGFPSGGTGASRKYAVVDKSAKTNAQVVIINGLNASYAQISEIVVLNGTTAVDTVLTTWFRCNSFRVIAAGSNGVALGNLTLRADGAGATYSYIAAAFTRGRKCVYTVAAGKTLYINEWNVGAAANNDTKVQTARVILRANRDPFNGFLTGGIFYGLMELMVTNAVIPLACSLPGRFAETTDIRVDATGLTGFSGPVSSILRGYLVTE